MAVVERVFGQKRRNFWGSHAGKGYELLHRHKRPVTPEYLKPLTRCESFIESL